MRRRRADWVDGNRVRLLENGEEFYPRVFECIAQARAEVLIETFILFDDKVGRQLQEAVLAAAGRGVHVEITVDGYGSPDLSAEFVGAMTAAGVRFEVFDPQPRLFGVRLNLFRRLHRKIVVVDGRIGFIGGINFSHDHLRDYGPEAKQDYAVEVEGPVVAQMRELVQRQRLKLPVQRRRWWRWDRRAPVPQGEVPPAAGEAATAFVTRDNHHHQDDIEWHYRVAIRAAQREVIIANAYFFPGFRVIRELRRAARRGVQVILILQGNPDMAIVRWAALTLYDYLLRAGVRIFEFCERPQHGKVATVDGEWSTVGSSNLDPLSLYLNLEANLIIRDHAFTQDLRQRLLHLMDHSCKEIDTQRAPRRTPIRLFLSYVAFHLMRRFPRWAGWLPAHTPVRQVLAPQLPAANVETPKREAA